MDSSNKDYNLSSTKKLLNHLITTIKAFMKAFYKRIYLDTLVQKIFLKVP